MCFVATAYASSSPTLLSYTLWPCAVAALAASQAAAVGEIAARLSAAGAVTAAAGEQGTQPTPVAPCGMSAARCMLPALCHVQQQLASQASCPGCAQQAVLRQPWCVCECVCAASAGAFQAVLDLHNTLRARHQAPPLEWDATVASVAQAYANRCRFAHNSNLRQLGYGENLALGYSSYTAAVQAWYDEVRRGKAHASVAQS